MKLPNIPKIWNSLTRFKQATQMFKGVLFGEAASLIADDSTAYVEDGYQHNPTVYSVINLITSAISGVPWVLFEEKNGERTEITEHKILDVLNRPNPLQGKSEWIKNVIGFKLVTGNSLVYGVGPEEGVNKGQFHELWVLPSQTVQQIEIDNMGMPKNYLISGTTFERLPAERIMHLKNWNPDPARRYFGMSPIQAARLSITASNDSYTSALKLLKNTGAVGALVQKADERIDPMTEPQAQKLEEKYEEKMGNVNQRGKVFVSNVPLEWIQFGMSAVDLGLMEQMKMTKRDICSVYNTPSELLNDSENKTYSNMREARKALITNAALPELKSLRDELMRWFVPPYEQNNKLILDIDMNSIVELQRDLELLTAQAAQSWWLTPNERRDMVGFDKIEEIAEMDMIWIPSNFIPAGATTEAKALEEITKQLYEFNEN